MNRTEPLPLVLSLALAAGLMGWIIWSQWPADPVAAIQAPPAQTLPCAGGAAARRRGARGGAARGRRERA